MISRGRTLRQGPGPMPLAINVTPQAQSPYWWQTGGQFTAAPISVVVQTPQGTTAPGVMAASAPVSQVPGYLGTWGPWVPVWVLQHPYMTAGAILGAIFLVRSMKRPGSPIGRRY